MLRPWSGRLSRRASVTAATTRLRSIASKEPSTLRQFDDQPQPHETRELRVQLSLITGLYSVQSFGSGMVSTCIPMYATAIGLPESVGLIVALPSMAALFVNIPGGVVVDIFGRKRPLIVGALMTGFGTLWMAVSGGMASVIGNHWCI